MNLSKYRFMVWVGASVKMLNWCWAKMPMSVLFRGTGIGLSGGDIAVGDNIKIDLPAKPFRHLERV